MNWLELWTESPMAKAVGRALLHSLWEGAAAAALLAAALYVFRSPRARYAAACAALAALLAGLAITVRSVWPSSRGAAAPPIALARTPLTEAGPLDVMPPVRLLPADVPPWLAPIWIVGVIAFHLRAFAGWLFARRLRRWGVCCAPGDWDARLARLASRLRISHPVRLLESSLADTPVVVAHLRPVILMPIGLLAGLPPNQVEAILAHELAHIARRDYLVNLFQTFIEGLLFYHPAVWWMSRVISSERENCCDDVAIDLCGDRTAYAGALAALAQNRYVARELALAATGGSLVKRIRRILRYQEGARAGFAPLASAVVLSLATAAGLAAWQTAAPTLFPPPKPEPQAATVAAPRPLPAPAPAPPAEAAVANPAPVQQPQADQLQKLAQQLKKEQLRPAAAALPDPYRKWLNQDVAYIITDEERAALQSLETDAQREGFIEQFWLKRDPTPVRQRTR